MSGHGVRVGGQCHVLAALPLEKIPDAHCIGGWVEPGQSEPLQKISPSTGIDSRTVQPVASRHTGYAFPARV
jgi:hypothetical protein